MEDLTELELYSYPTIVSMIPEDHIAPLDDAVDKWAYFTGFDPSRLMFALDSSTKMVFFILPMKTGK